MRKDLVDEESSPLRLFCGHIKKSKGQHGKESLSNCETAVAAKSIYDTVVSLNDVEMLARISCVDIIAKEVKYHHSCKRAYFNKVQKKGTSTLDTQADGTSHDYLCT